MKLSKIFVRNLHFTNKLDKINLSKDNYKLDKINLSDGNSIVVLSTIDNGPEFRDQLFFLLNGLDKSSSYELEFSMYIRTNDHNKKLLDLPLPNSNVSPGNFLTTLLIFENIYKFKGYFGFINDKYFYNSKQDLIRFVSSIYTRLSEKVINTNEILDHDEFIEFKRPVIINIKIDSKDSKDNKS